MGLTPELRSILDAARLGMIVPALEELGVEEVDDFSLVEDAGWGQGMRAASAPSDRSHTARRTSVGGVRSWVCPRCFLTGLRRNNDHHPWTWSS